MKCEASTQPTFYWDPKKIDFPGCSRQAAIRIDGISLCVQHASGIALQKAIHAGNAEVIRKTPSLCHTVNDRFANHIISDKDL